MLRAGLAALLLCAAPAAALAQQPPPDGAGSEVELGEDAPPINTGDEDEDAPRIGVDQTKPVAEVPKTRVGAYPMTEVLRPLTLPDFTSEIRLETLFYPTPVEAELTLRARYGITRQIQVGVAYGIGGFYNDGKRDKVRFNTGKAVAIELSYLAADWIAPRLTVPMYVDPFAIGIELGAPVKFRFGDRFAVVGFEEMIGFKLIGDKFLPDLRHEKANEAAVDELTSGTIQSDGYFKIDGGVLYQLAPDLVVSGRFGVTLEDFAGGDVPTSLRALVQFTPVGAVDLVGEAGWDRLDANRGSLHLSAALAFRI